MDIGYQESHERDVRI